MRRAGRIPLAVEGLVQPAFRAFVHGPVDAGAPRLGPLRGRPRAPPVGALQVRAAGRIRGCGGMDLRRELRAVKAAPRMVRLAVSWELGARLNRFPQTGRDWFWGLLWARSAPGTRASRWLARRYGEA